MHLFYTREIPKLQTHMLKSGLWYYQRVLIDNQYGDLSFLFFYIAQKQLFLFVLQLFFVWEKLLVLGKRTPKYLKLSTTSIGCSLKLKARWHDLWPKITIFDFSGLTLSFHLTQYDWNSLSSCCNSSSLSAHKTVSSAYSITTNFK